MTRPSQIDGVDKQARKVDRTSRTLALRIP
jgi:hypothetical protein